MKKIILLGDSIRMGYDKYVKTALEGTAEVYYPKENCRFAQHTLRFLHEWAKKEAFPDDIDLVHWNAGLWDVLELFGDGPLSEKDAYARTILRIQKRIKLLYPNAKQVFATSTAVIEELFKSQFKRHNENIKAYNKAAIEALEGTGTIINDLFALTFNCPREWHNNDPTHFETYEGLENIGGQVISVICRELDISAEKVNIKDFQPEKYSVKNIGQ